MMSMLYDENLTMINYCDIILRYFRRLKSWKRCCLCNLFWLTTGGGGYTPPHNLTSHSTTANRRLPSKQTQVHFIHVCAMRNNRSLSTVFSYSKICIRQMRNSGNLGKNIGKWKTGFVNTRHFSKQRGAVVSKATPVVCGFLFRTHFVVWLRAAWPLGRFQTAIN